jgi:hypothetical protein
MRKITVGKVSAEIRNIDLSKSAVSCRTGFVVFHYSLIRNHVPSNDQFDFQDILVKINYICQGM